MSTEIDSFDDATYYDADESAETLQYENAEGAIEHIVGENIYMGHGVSAALDELGSVTVYAWQRKPITDQDWQWIGERAAEGMAEHFDDEFGDSDESVLSRCGVHEPTLAAELGEVFKRHVIGDGAVDPVSQCERVGQRTYPRAEVEAMLREHCPEWFTVKR